MMQAPNDKIFHIKVVGILKTINLDLNFASFGFLMRKLWALEVGLFHISMHLVQSDL
jgi:hypothetical protein